MFISKKIAKYFEENKDKPKDEVVEGLMKNFGYKESTAKAYYANRNTVKYSINRHKIAFDFFEANPNVLDDIDNKKYADELGMSIATYSNYKCMFKVEIQKKNLKLIQAKREEEKNKPNEDRKYGEKYYKNRLRQKFTFNDGKLFG